MEKLTILWQIKRLSSDLRRRPFFFGLHLLLGKNPEILVEVSTDFVRQTCNYSEFILDKNACGVQ